MCEDHKLFPIIILSFIVAIVIKALIKRYKNKFRGRKIEVIKEKMPIHSGIITSYDIGNLHCFAFLCIL